MTSLGWALADGAVVAKRNLIKIKRVPEVLVWVLMSPIMFVLLFVYVFGSSIDVPGVPYKEWLIAGIFAQTVVFGSTFTGAGIAEDMSKGIIDRFRSLPMSRSAVLAGRTASDVVYNVLLGRDHGAHRAARRLAGAHLAARGGLRFPAPAALQLRLLAG